MIDQINLGMWKFYYINKLICVQAITTAGREYTNVLRKEINVICIKNTE